jgi:hypothetical protein
VRKRWLVGRTVSSVFLSVLVVVMWAVRAKRPPYGLPRVDVDVRAGVGGVLDFLHAHEQE